MNEILILCREASPRLEYVSEFIFRDVLQSSVSLISLEDLPEGTGNIINYSEKKSTSAFHVKPYGLLEESGTVPKDIRLFHHEGVPYLFPVENSDTSFDPFSAIFYLISRYEEYLPYEGDHYGRYQAKDSIAGKENFLKIPVVDMWIRELARELMSFYPGLKFPEPRSAFIPTIDIDNPWAFLHKSFYRKIGGVAKDIMSINYDKLNYRLSVLGMRRKDPFDSYEYIQRVHSGNLKIFYLLGNRSRHDNKISYRNPAWREMVKKLSGNFEAGIHPSWYSNKNLTIVKEEKIALEQITGREILISRQHFLKSEFPMTYRNLLSTGIKEDYSMGYAETPGFRAGTSYPFRFYDLNKEQVTDLRIFPFMVMDRTLKDYLHSEPGEAKEIISGLIETMKKFGGNFISVWHNESLGTAGEWQDWREVYDYLLEKGNELNVNS